MSNYKHLVVDNEHFDKISFEAYKQGKGKNIVTQEAIKQYCDLKKLEREVRKREKYGTVN